MQNPRLTVVGRRAMSFWSVLRTHPNCEKMAIRNLENQDFSYYQPKLLERKLRQRRWVNVEIPLFPNYLFVQIASRWACLNNTHGVAALLMVGNNPAVVQDNVISSLRSREINGFIKLPTDRLAVGDKVRIQTGPFAQQLALVDRMSAKERQKILLSLLDNKIKVLVDERDVVNFDS